MMKMNSFKWIAFIVMGLAVAAQDSSSQSSEEEFSCPENEQWNECGTNCPANCDNKDEENRICNLACKIGCECVDGYVRKDGSENASCVPENECCAANEEYSECKTSCPAYCGSEDDDPRICTADCKLGCVCKSGYTRQNSSENAACVPEESCNCSNGEEWNTCGSSCPKTCANKDEDIVCNRMCNIGCFCKDGYVRQDDSDDAQCVLEEECCSENQEYQTCGSSCPDYCGSENDGVRACTADCKVGCFCKEGYKLETEDSDKCIPDSECSK